MAEITQLIHNYLRHNKKFPHVFCPGCGHGIVLGSLIRSVHMLNLPKDDVVLVAGIGCSGRLAVYVDFNTVHGAHGRALPVATGVKMANPNLTVIVVMGDGDALSIGGNHLIHAARRNIGVTALILNNNVYGMTGGQCSSTTPPGAKTTTSPFGQLENAFDAMELAKVCGANYVARSTAFHASLTDKLFCEAFTRPGFNLIEVLTPCHTQYGRKNQFKSIVDMYRDLKNRTLDVAAYEKLPEDKKAERIPIGVFAAKDQPSLEANYAAMQARLQEGAA